AAKDSRVCGFDPAPIGVGTPCKLASGPCASVRTDRARLRPHGAANQGRRCERRAKFVDPAPSPFCELSGNRPRQSGLWSPAFAREALTLNLPGGELLLKVSPSSSPRVREENVQFGASTFVWASPFGADSLDLIDKV